MKLEGKIAIVTGAGDGIGRGIALALAREGADVALCELNESTLRETERLVRDTSRRAFARALDIRDAEAIAQFVRDAEASLGGIDILVNNAAVMPVAPCDSIDPQTIDHILQVNLKAPILFTQHVIAPMRRRGGGSIIHMASVTGHNGFSGITVYGATKGALMALARGQAIELAKDRIRVNTVSPGTVDSPMLREFLRKHSADPAKARAAFDQIHPRGQVASIDEVARVFVFLASDDAANITATDIRCDGGYCVQGTQPRQ